MSVVKHFIEDSIKKAEIDEFLRNEFERAGYGGVSITKTPLGTHLVVYTMRPGLVIGRGGETIRALASVLEEKFQLPSPQISVAEIEIPELNAHVVASRISSALKRGVHYRRAGFWALTQAMDAGALGIEITISGKLRTDRARYEKFRTGYLPKSGEPPRKYMRQAVLHVQLKPGTLGVNVRLLPPDAQFPDQVKVHVIEEELEREPEQEIVEETVLPEEAVIEPTVSPVEEKIVSDEKVAEAEVAPAEDKTVTEAKTVPPVENVVTEEKVVKAVVPAVEEKVVTAEKPIKAKVQSVAKKLVAEKKVAKKTVSPANEKVVSSKKKVTEPVVVPVKEKKVAKTKATITEAKVVTEKKAVAPVKKKVVAKKQVAKAKVPVVKKKPVAEKKVEKKVAKPKVTPVKEKKVAKKKVAKAKAPAKEKKEAGK